MNLVKEHIKTILIVVLVITTSVFAYKYFNERPLVKAPASKEATELEEDNETDAGEKVNGRVMDYGMNHIGDIDKILIETSTRKMWLHFPPHTAKKVLTIAVKHAFIIATVAEIRPNPENETTAELLTIASKKTNTIINIEDIPPPAPTVGAEITISGNAVQFQFDGHGHTSGFILSGKLIELKPKMAEVLSSLLQNATSIQVKGFARSNDNGAVNKQGYILVKPILITIDNTNYTVQ